MRPKAINKIIVGLGYLFLYLLIVYIFLILTKRTLVKTGYDVYYLIGSVIEVSFNLSFVIHAKNNRCLF